MGVVTLDDLRVFVAVCRAGSLSAVARDLSCTQSAVSQHVRRLERETATSLLERQPRGVVPTAAGRILCDAAADKIAGLDLALRRLGDFVNGESGSVRITTGGTTVRHFMAEAIVSFRRRFSEGEPGVPDRDFQPRCFDTLLTGNLDLAWVTVGGPVRGIEQRPVIDLPWVLAVRSNDPLAARPRIEAFDLTGIRLVRLPPNSTSDAHLDAVFAELGIRTGSDTSVADWDTALLLAELGLGHAVVPAVPDLATPGDGGPLRHPDSGAAAAVGRLGRTALGRPLPARTDLCRHGGRKLREDAPHRWAGYSLDVRQMKRRGPQGSPDRG